MERTSKRRGGNSLVEFSLIMPWYVFLFIGVFDFGFYGYSLTALEDGVRVAALNASQNSTVAASSATACTYVVGSLKNLPNIGTSVTTCTASPLTVSASYGAAAGPDGGPATTISATYTSPLLVSIPNLIPSQITTTRTLQMRVR
jgi:Flp pilus assembly protein TadG